MDLWELKQAEHGERTPHKALFLQAENVHRDLWLLLSGIAHIPRKAGGTGEGWALIMSDGRWEACYHVFQENVRDLFVHLLSYWAFLKRWELYSYNLRGRLSFLLKSWALPVSPRSHCCREGGIKCKRFESLSRVHSFVLHRMYLN